MLRTCGRVWNLSALTAFRAPTMRKLPHYLAAFSGRHQLSLRGLSTLSSTQMQPSTPATPQKPARRRPDFTELGLPSWLSPKLQAMRVSGKPSAVQQAAIGAMLRPYNSELKTVAPAPDLIIDDITGSGKTLAYLLPMLANVDNYSPNLQAIILVPSRELAVQVASVAAELCRGGKKARKQHPVVIALGVGSVNPYMVAQMRKQQPHILIGTPDVVHGLVVHERCVSVGQLKYTIVDEADYLLVRRAWTASTEQLLKLAHHTADNDNSREAARMAAKLMPVQPRRPRNYDQEQEESDAENSDVAEGNQDSELEAGGNANARDSNASAASSQRQRADSEAPNAADAADSKASAQQSLSRPLVQQLVFVTATVTRPVLDAAKRFMQPGFLHVSRNAGQNSRNNSSSSRSDRLSVSENTNSEHSSVTTAATGSESKENASESNANESSGLRSAEAAAVAMENRIPPLIQHHYTPYDGKFGSKQSVLVRMLQVLREGNISRPAVTASSSVEANERAMEHKQSSSSKQQPQQQQQQQKERPPEFRGALVFFNTRPGVQQEMRTVAEELQQAGFSAAAVSEHSERQQRKAAFRAETEVILATDVMSRGMDLGHLTHVVSYDAAESDNIYLHRAGRVGRLGSRNPGRGTVITMGSVFAGHRFNSSVATAEAEDGRDAARMQQTAAHLGFPVTLLRLRSLNKGGAAAGASQRSKPGASRRNKLKSQQQQQKDAGGHFLIEGKPLVATTTQPTAAATELNTADSRETEPQAPVRERVRHRSPDRKRSPRRRESRERYSERRSSRGRSPDA